MKVPIWILAKPGHETIVSARMPTEERAAALRADGYDVLYGEVTLPERYNVSTDVVKVKMRRTG